VSYVLKRTAQKCENPSFRIRVGLYILFLVEAWRRIVTISGLAAADGKKKGGPERAAEALQFLKLI
jgi:hypothetical protein